MTESAVAESDLSLGWLEAFIAASRHRSYEKAGTELGIDPPNVQRAVFKLEAWLRRVLVTDDFPLRVSEPCGVGFLPIAEKVLQLFDDGCSVPSVLTTDTRLALRKNERSSIRLKHLETFLVVAEERVYKRAAGKLGTDTETVRRNVKALEQELGAALVKGHSTLQLTEAGAAFVEKAQHICTLLTHYRADIPDNFDPAPALARRVYWLVTKRCTNLRMSIASWERSRKLRPAERERLLGARKSLAILEETRKELEREFGPFTEPNAANLKVS